MYESLQPFLTAIAACPWCGHSLRSPSDPPSEAARPSPACTCAHCGRATTISLKAGKPIWDAMGPHHAPRTLAQLSNVVWPTARIYERLWRVRSLSLLSGRAFPTTEELAELTKALGRCPDEGGVVVDVGCSEGLYARHLAGVGWSVVAVDHSRSFLASMARRAVRLPPVVADRIAAVRATAQALPLVDACVDAVVIGGSLNEIGDAALALREAERVLRPGGVLFSMHLTNGRTRAGRALQRVLRTTGIRPYSEQSITRMLGSGFSVESYVVDGVVVRLVATRNETPFAERVA